MLVMQAVENVLPILLPTENEDENANFSEIDAIRVLTYSRLRSLFACDCCGTGVVYDYSAWAQDENFSGCGGG